MIKILATSALPLTSRELVRCAAQTEEQDTEPVQLFLRERVEFYLREVAALDADVVSAVLAADADAIPDAMARGEALRTVRGSDDLAAIAAAWKRTKNILRQAEEKNLSRPDSADEALFAEDAERQLWQAFQQSLPQVARLRADRGYREALETIASLRPHVDRFFDTTMVLAEDPALRGNRLALLSAIVTEFSRIADFSELVTPAQEPAR